MNDIKEISPEAGIGKVGRGQPAAPQKTAEEVRQEQAADVAKKQDSLQVDQQRKQEAHLIENSRLFLDELPDVRAYRVQQAKRRLQEGYYNRPEVLEETAAKLLQDESEISAENVKQAQNKLAGGQYDKPEVLDETAQRIIRDIDK